MCHYKILKVAFAISACAAMATNASAFEGRISAMTTQGGEANELLYTVGTNFARVEMTATNWPNPVDVVDLKSGALTLLFPHNRSFVRLKPDAENAAAPGAPGMPRPPGMEPRPPFPMAPGVPAMPAMRPMPPAEKFELQATGRQTNILGFACAEYEIKRRGETLEIWATDQLFPYQPYVRHQAPRFGPRMIDEQWPKLVAERKLFPLRASLRFDNGAERYRFEVKSVTPEKLTDADAPLFQPPPGYFEIEPLPF
jgi:hypothetical protein